MDVIIRLIIRILEEIFSQDSQRRNPQSAVSGPSQQSSRQRSGRQADRSDLLTRVLQDIDEYPPQAARNQGALAPFPPPVPVSDPAAQSLADHLAALSRRDELRELEMEERLHLDHKLQHQELQEILAPSERTPLEQMIIAGVILGPCKVHMRDPRLHP